MIGLDSAFIIDFLNGNEDAMVKARELHGQRILATPVNVFEVLLGAMIVKRDPKENLAAAKKFFGRVDVLDITESSAELAARMEADMMSKGQEASVTDMLTASVYLSNGCTRIVTRDRDFERIKGLAIERY